MTRFRVNHSAAPVAGYTDRLSARPGERITVHASATDPECAVRVLRISHDGTRPVRTPVEIPAPVKVFVPHQQLDLGSYGLVENPPALARAVTFAAWVWPTALPEDRAGVITQGEAVSGPFAALYLLGDGRVGFDVSTVEGVVSVRTGASLRLRRWYLLVGGYDPERGARLTVWPRDPLADEEVPMRAGAAPRGDLVAGAPAVVLAGFRARGEVTGNLDGKIGSPAVFDRLVDGRDLTGARAQWDLSHDIPGERMVDVIDGHDGRLYNLPTRGVTGHDWTGDVLDWRHAEHGYGAVHFHSDDVGDAGWDPVLTLELPAGLPSGCYAVELSTSEGVDRPPFFVRGARHSSMALLVPTLSYIAYALDHLRMPMMPEDPAEVAARFGRDNRLHSLYDRHTDGSGVCQVSLRRPLLGMRDDHVFRYNDSPHQYSEDVQLVGWLERQGFAFNVLTDHDLHADPEALAGYRTVLTGSHPEYWTGAMLDAMHGHLATGGSLAYLGGNGAYWVTAVAPDRPHVTELRRGYAGVRTWECEPGELHLACTGEPGGLWAERGRSPHRLFGIGTSAAGMTPGGPYELIDGHPLLAGIDASAPLGAFGTVLGAAASFETDGIDAYLGSPPGIRLLGRAMLGDHYLSADTGPAVPHPHSDPVDRRRADLTLLETAGGGQVFSTGSIGWCGALSHNGDDNDVSRLTAGVLRSFCQGVPAPRPGRRSAEGSVSANRRPTTASRGYQPRPDFGFDTAKGRSPMPLHPDARAFIEQNGSEFEPDTLPSPAELRAAFAATYTVPSTLEPVGRVYERTIPGPAGELRVRVYEPDGAGPCPALVWFHGGGWVIGSLDENEATCRVLCRQVGAVVVSVEYRLAPEHKYPAAAEDAYAALLWVAARGDEIRADRQRIAIAGESAGANLATVACLMARDRGGPRPVLQLLASPVTAPPGDRPSYVEFADGYFFTRANMEWFFQLYPRTEADLKEPYLSPLLAEDLSGLPPALVMVAEYELLRDEGEQYAHRLLDAGVPVELVRYPGQIHGFFALLTEQLSISAFAHRRAAAALRKAFATKGRS